MHRIARIHAGLSLAFCHKLTPRSPVLSSVHLLVVCSFWYSCPFSCSYSTLTRRLGLRRHWIQQPRVRAVLRGPHRSGEERHGALQPLYVFTLRYSALLCVTLSIHTSTHSPVPRQRLRCPSSCPPAAPPFSPVLLVRCPVACHATDVHWHCSPTRRSLPPCR